MKTMNKILLALLLVLLFLAAGLFGAFHYFRAEASPLDAPENAVAYDFEITGGMTAASVSKLLFENKIVRNERLCYLAARFPVLGSILTGASEDIFTIKKGFCSVQSSLSLADVYRILSAGRERLTPVSIPEGLTISKIAERLEKAGVCPAADFKKAAGGREGFLFPDTYMLNKNMSAEQIVQSMEKNFYERIASVPNLKNVAPGRLLYIVTLASIIEREYRTEEEAPLISSVFQNRLKHNIGLYSCATVEYVITEVLGRPHPDIITYDDLKIKSPYNTYLNAGLPPAPICNPGLVALNAAANPAVTDYYYFQLMDENEGRHVFSRTLDEHVRQGAIFKTKKATR